MEDFTVKNGGNLIFDPGSPQSHLNPVYIQKGHIAGGRCIISVGICSQARKIEEEQPDHLYTKNGLLREIKR